MMCKSFGSVDCRNSNEIKSLVESHEWISVSSDKTPVGMISRFTCVRCGDEYVVMVTSPSAIESRDATPRKIEVTAGDIALF